MAAQASQGTGTRRARGGPLTRGRRSAAAAGCPDRGADARARWAVVVLAGLLVAGTPGVVPDAVAAPATLPATLPGGQAVAGVRPVATQVDPPPAAPTQEAADRAARLAALEAAVVAAETAAADLASATALTPRPPTARTPDGDQRFTRINTPGGAPVRLHPDAPAAVVALVRAYPNGAVPPVALCPVPFARTALLQCDAAKALERLDAAYLEQFGTHLSVTSAYRTFESQVGLRASKGGLAAVPGTSNHGWGLAVDLGGIGGLGEFDSLEYLWLKANAERFGWHHPRVMEPGGGGPQEPWHWEFATA